MMAFGSVLGASHRLRQCPDPANPALVLFCTKEIYSSSMAVLSL